MSKYKQLDKVELAWRENKELINLQIRQLARRVANEALAELDDQFLNALSRGEILEINPTKSELKELLFKHAQKELTT